jgi:hypothetical protein
MGSKAKCLDGGGQYAHDTSGTFQHFKIVTYIIWIANWDFGWGHL